MYDFMSEVRITATIQTLQQINLTVPEFKKENYLKLLETTVNEALKLK